MTQDVKNMMDRDTEVAAILAGGWGSARNADEAIERFRQTLIALRRAGGAREIWTDAQTKGAE